MNYTTLYRVHGLATAADAPLTNLAGFGIALAAFILAPRVFDALLARINARYRRACMCKPSP